jgi:hypothetical protein
LEDASDELTFELDVNDVLILVLFAESSMAINAATQQAATTA